MTDAKRSYPDLHEHLEALKKRGLLLTIDRPINKDAELHPLVRWQYVGGIEEHERKAFLFTNVVDGGGRKYRFPVVVGALAGNRVIYGVGMRVPLEKIQERWDRAIANPVPPRIVKKAICQEVVIEGAALKGAGNGLDMLPIPISTPGFDGAPTLTATNVITKDPETGVQNHGTYRGGLKAPDRCVIRMATRVGGAGGYRHYLKYQKRGDKHMPCAIVLGAPPCVAFVAPMGTATSRTPATDGPSVTDQVPEAPRGGVTPRERKRTTSAGSPSALVASSMVKSTSFIAAPPPSGR